MAPKPYLTYLRFLELPCPCNFFFLSSFLIQSATLPYAFSIHLFFPLRLVGVEFLSITTKINQTIRQMTVTLYDQLLMLTFVQLTLNNASWNYTDPLIHDFFFNRNSYSTIQSEAQLNLGIYIYMQSTINYTQIFDFLKGQCP